MYAALLLVAIAVEIASTALLPRADGFRDVPWSAAVILGYMLSIWLLSVVVRQIPVSVAYAIWSGVGTAAVAAIGMLFLGEGVGLLKLLFLAMIVIGVVGLNLVATR
ncbi:MAG: multidrug efflux SMR transporter [Nocardioides sp.]|nr:multidrug efflux SMR transporter [Nocardioides sp.]